MNYLAIFAIVYNEQLNMSVLFVYLLPPGSGSCRFSYSDPSIRVSYSLNGNANTSEDWITLEKIRSFFLSYLFLLPHPSHSPSIC